MRPEDKQKVLDDLCGYPDKSCDMGRNFRILRPANKKFNYNSTQWTAWQYHREMKNLKSVIKQETDPQLITKYFQTIINKLGDEFSNNKYPGLQLAVKTANRNNITVIITNLIPDISRQLEKISKGEDEKNVIINLADGIENCVKSLKNIIIIDKYQIIRFDNRYNFPWPANKQCDFAQSTCYNICNNSNLNKQEKIKEIIEIYNVLVKTMQQCSGFVSNLTKNVTFSEYAEGLDKSVPLIYKCLSEIKNKTSDFSRYPLNTFLDSRYRPDQYSWKKRAQFEDVRESVNKYCQMSLPSERERTKLIIEKIMSFVRNVKADAGQSTNTVDWIKKLGFAKPEISETNNFKII